MISEDSFSSVQRYFFLGLLAAVTLLFLWMLKSYLLLILWATVLAILLFPIFRIIKDKIANGSIAASLTMLLAIVCIFIPLVFVSILLADDAVSVYQSAAMSTPAYIEAVSNNPYTESALTFFEVEIAEIETLVINAARTASAWVASQILSIGVKTFSVILKLFIMLYLLFFFLRDGEKILDKIGKSISIGGGREKALFDRFSQTVEAMFKGTILIAIFQGILGGILFWAVGIDNVVLWGSLMAFLSIIPAVGPSFVWLPAAVIYFALGSPGVAIALIAGGAGISLIENLLKPMLVGRSTKMPDALILISIFGGIVTFGITGVILGPVIAALFLSLWNFFAQEYRSELTEKV